MKRLAAVLLLLLSATACGGGQNPAEAQPPTPVPLVQDPETLPTLFANLPPSPPPLSTIPRPASLTTAQMHAQLDPFAQAGCALPCYLGLTPGESDLQAALEVYAALGISPADLLPGDTQTVELGSGGLGAWLTKTSDADQGAAQGLAAPLLDMTLESGQLTTLYIAWGYEPPYLSLPRLLAEAGPPQAVNVGVFPAEDPQQYLLHVIYGEAREAAYGIAVYGNLTPDRQICPVGDGVQRLYLGTFAPSEVPLTGLSGEESLAPLTLEYELLLGALTGPGCIPV